MTLPCLVRDMIGVGERRRKEKKKEKAERKKLEKRRGRDEELTISQFNIYLISQSDMCFATRNWRGKKR